MKKLFILAVILLAAGCAAAPNPIYYRVDYAIGPGEISQPPLPLVLRVERLAASDPLNQPNILYRTTDRTIEYHPYRLWESPPVRLANHYLVQTLKASNRFKLVTVDRISQDPDLILTGWLNRFEEVDRPTGWWAEVEIEFELTTGDGKRTVATGRSQGSVKAAAKTTDAVAGAMAVALRQTIDQVTGEVAQAAQDYNQSKP